VVQVAALIAAPAHGRLTATAKRHEDSLPLEARAESAPARSVTWSEAGNLAAFHPAAEPASAAEVERVAEAVMAADAVKNIDQSGVGK
jgi:hypothetical protein